MFLHIKQKCMCMKTQHTALTIKLYRPGEYWIMCGIVCCYENVKTAQLYPGKVTALLSANQSIKLFHFPETHLQGIYATWIWKSSKSTIQVTNSTIIIGTVLCIKVKCKEKYLLVSKYNLYSVLKIVSIGQSLVKITLYEGALSVYRCAQCV